MIKIHKGENDYIGIEMKAKWNGETLSWLTPKELEQLFKKIGKILGKGKNYCVHCKADLK